MVTHTRDEAEAHGALQWIRGARGGVRERGSRLDHCLGLLSLRESQPLTVYATERVRRGFCEHNRLYRTLERGSSGGPGNERSSDGEEP